MKEESCSKGKRKKKTKESIDEKGNLYDGVWHTNGEGKELNIKNKENYKNEWTYVGNTCNNNERIGNP
jgi:hypothetical protein